MPDLAWSERPAFVRDALAPIAFLLGDWEGSGTADGVPIQGRLSVRAILDGTFFEAHERLFRSDGTLDHEDRVFYRYAMEDHSIRALHLQSPAWADDRYVNIVTNPTGLVWSSGPTVPRVQILHIDDTLDVRVYLPDSKAPASHLVYRPRT